MAMITCADKASWPFDTSLTNLASAEPRSPSVARAKLFTLDHRFVIRNAGRLATPDAMFIETALDALRLSKNVQRGKSR
ncbi:MAG: hypothetical protein ABI277_14445 [Burkholderiaceae bacterium]